MTNYTIINGSTWLLNDKFELDKKVDSVPTDSILHKPYILAEKFFYAVEGDDNVRIIAIQLNDYAMDVLTNDSFINQYTQVKKLVDNLHNYRFDSNFITKLLDWEFDVSLQANEAKIVFISDEDINTFDYDANNDDSLNYYSHNDLTLNRQMDEHTHLYFNFYSKYTNDVIKTRLHLEEIKNILNALK